MAANRFAAMPADDTQHHLFIAYQQPFLQTERSRTTEYILYFAGMGNFMESAFNSIDESCDLEVAYFRHTPDGIDYFYFLEQSSIQVLRELPSDSHIKVTEIFSERHRIAQKIDIIKAVQTVGDFLAIALPLVENGNFPCKNITIIINDQVRLECKEDVEVQLISSYKTEVRCLATRILVRQGYDLRLLDFIVNNPELYHKLERPNRIIESFKTFEELIEAI